MVAELTRPRPPEYKHLLECPYATELPLTPFILLAGALAAATVVRGRTRIDHMGVPHACCAVWAPLQQHRARFGGTRATRVAHQLARKARRRSRPQHHDVAPSLPATGIQAWSAPSTSRLLNAKSRFLAKPLVEEVQQRAQHGTRVRRGGRGWQSSRFRPFERAVLSLAQAPNTWKEIDSLREGYCVFHSPSPILQNGAIICPSLTTHVPAALLTPPNRSQVTQPTLVPWCVTAQFCSVLRGGRGGYSRYVSRRHMPHTHAEFAHGLCEYRSNGSEGARSSQNCS